MQLTQLPRFALICSLLALSQIGCQLATNCTPMRGMLSGDRVQDLLGSWEGELVNRKVVYDFRPDGTYRLIEEPGTAVPEGTTQDGPFTLAGDRLTLGASPATRIDVTEATLTMSDPVPITYVRSKCSGYGF